jgi:hypothetical protein
MGFHLPNKFEGLTVNNAVILFQKVLLCYLDVARLVYSTELWTSDNMITESG